MNRNRVTVALFTAALFTAALGWQPTLWAGTSPTTVLEGQQIVDTNADHLGTNLAVDGNLAAASSQSTGEIYVYVFDDSSQSWITGPVIAPPDALAISAIALDGSQLYYVVITDLANPQQYEIRVQTLFFPQQATTVSTGSGPVPLHLHARADVVVAGFPPDLLRGIGIGSYSVRAWRDQGGWQQILDEEGPGRAVATNGSRIFASDPGLGSHGGVVVYTAVGGIWQELETILYDDPLQDDVDFGAAIAAEGSCLAVGAPNYDTGVLFPPRTNDVGAAHIFSFDALTLSYESEAVLTSDAALEDDHFGYTVALQGANLVLAGHSVQRSNGNPQGDATLFRRSGSSCDGASWRQVHRLRGADLVFAPDAQGAFGLAAGLSHEAGVLVADPSGPVDAGDGALYAYPGLVALFVDGFENGDTSGWSATQP